MSVAQTEAVVMSDKKHQYCTFWVAGRLFGVDILDVKEIQPDVVLTPVYHAPKEVKGYVNIRGQIHLILDLRLILGFEEKAADSDSCLVIFKPGVAEPFGVLVDKISDVADVTSDQVEESRDSGGPGAGMEKKAKVVDRICKLDKALLEVLNAKKILKSIDATRDEN